MVRLELGVRVYGRFGKMDTKVKPGVAIDIEFIKWVNKNALLVRVIVYVN